MPRKPATGYAVLAIPPEKLGKRIKDKNMTLREIADMCGHSSHSHIYRLTTGQVKTTSTRTADLLEAVLDARGLLFGRVAAKPVGRAA